MVPMEREEDLLNSFIIGILILMSKLKNGKIFYSDRTL